MPEPVKPPALPKPPELPPPPSPEKLLALLPPPDAILSQIATSTVGGLLDGARDFITSQIKTAFEAIKPPGGK